MPKEKRIDQLNVQRLKERNLWGESVASTVATSEPLNSPDWNIIGVANTGVKAYILLSFNNQPDKLIELKQGDSLPGGAKILAIEQDKIRILLNGKSRQLFLQRD